MATVDRELDEALETLVGDAGTIFQAAKGLAKATLSGRPDNLKEESVREWLRVPETRRLVKDAVTALVTHGDVDQFRRAAEASYATSSNDEHWWGGVVFDETIGFLALTVDNKLDTGSRLGVQVANYRADRIESAIDGLDARLAGNHDLLLQTAKHLIPVELPIDVLDRYVGEFVNDEQRSRAIEDGERLDRIRQLVGRVTDGDLKRVSSPVAIAALRLGAQIHARAGDHAEADRLLEVARSRGAVDLVIDEARIAICRADWPKASVLLDGLRDRHATGLVLEMIDRRDGRDAALRYHANYAPPAEIGGFMLPVVAHWLLDRGQESEAELLLASADDSHVAENVTLPFVRARLRIALMVSAPQRAGIYETAAALPRPDGLRDDGEGERLRAAALNDLAEAETLARSLARPQYLRVVEANRLYLQLGSPDDVTRHAAERYVLEQVANPDRVLDYAWLALAYDIDFDDRYVRSELDRTRSLGGWSGAQLMTALELALRDRNGGALLTFIEAHRGSMAAMLPVELAYGLEVEVLAKRGRIADARDRLRDAADLLTPEVIGRLGAIVDEQEGMNPIAFRMAAFSSSGSEADLNFLVQALADAEDDRTADYAMTLWRLRRRTKDAVLACNAMFNAGRDADLDDFLNEIADLVATDPRLLQHRAWSHYRSGALDKAREMLEPLRAAKPDDASLRQLAVNIAFEAGDLPRLAAIAAVDFERRDQRDAEQLMQAASMVHATGGELASELSRAAIAKAPDDPHVLLQAYGLALQRGLDWSPEASGWLQKAAELSGEAGPVQQGSLRDLLDQQAEGARNATDLNRLVMSGQIPLTLAVRPLGTTLSQLILGKLAENGSKPARARLCLPLISGNRPPTDLAGAGRIGLDPTAIYILHLTGLLRITLERLPDVVIPAGTLPLLLHDLERANRPQPARMEQMVRLRSLIDARRLHVIDLSDDEDELVLLHRSALDVGGRLVRSSPIVEPGSLGTRQVDPAPFADRLSSPHALVAALARRGEMSVEERDDALGRLTGYGAPWPAEPDVDLDQPLILHEVALYGLEYAMMLGPLLNSGADLRISRAVAERIDVELEQERLSKAYEQAVEEVRGQLALALSTGRATLGRFRRTPASESEERWSRDVETTPLISLLEVGSIADVLISGDRMLNRHMAFEDAAGTSRAIATPTDLIDHLCRLGIISEERRRGARRDLREAGVGLVPVEVEEILAAALEGDWSRGPGRSMRAIRDSIHLPLLRGAASLPTDRPWLNAISHALAIAIRGCWSELATVEAATAASSYLFELMPCLEAWTTADSTPGALEQALGTTSSSYMLLAMPANVPRERLDAYREWFTQLITLRLDGRDRSAAAHVIERLRVYLVAHEGLTMGSPPTVVPPSVVRRMLARNLPPRLFVSLMEHSDVREALGYRVDTVQLAKHEIGFEAMSAFFATTADGGTAELRDISDAIVATSPRLEEDGDVSASIGDRRGRFVEGGLFASMPEVRSRSLRRLFENRTIAPSQMDRWYAALAAGPLDLDLFRALMADIDATPQGYMARVATIGEIRYEDLVVVEPLYYRNLLDPERGDGTLPGTLHALASSHAAAPGPTNAIETLACLAISPDLPLTVMAAEISDEGVVELVKALEDAGDPFSMLAGFELAAARASSTFCTDAATNILESLLTEDAFDALIERFCVMGVLALNVFDVRGILADAPLGLRRCAALAHAGLMCRASKGFEVSMDGLLDQTLSWASPRWGLAAIVDQFEAPVWLRTWLQPAMLGPYVLRRVRQVMNRRSHSVPTRWSELVDARIQGFEEGEVEAGFGMPGPLDEFGSSVPEVPVSGTELVATLLAGTPSDVHAALFLFVSSHIALDGSGEVEQAIEKAAARFDGEDRRITVAMALAVAVRWRFAALADRLVETVHRDATRLGFDPIRIAEMSVAAAAAQAADLQLPTLHRLLERVAFGPLKPADTNSVAAFLDLLEDLRPGWAVHLERLRSACLLSA